MDDTRVYLIFNNISFRLRAVLSILLIATGLIFQTSSRNILVGLPFIVACMIFNLMKGISIKRIAPGKLAWKEVTPEKIEQVYEQCKKIKRFNSKDLGCFIAVLFLVIFLLPFLIPLLGVWQGVFPLVALFIDSVLLFGGLAASGGRSAWMPPDLDIKSAIVKRMLDSPLVKNDPGLQIIPYLEIAETSKGEMPNDARLLVKFRDGPEDLIGLQGQISVNHVKSKSYPYFYVVLIARPGFRLFERFGDQSVDRLVIENKETGEVDVIVIRQTTTKTSGYHTDDNTQDYILQQGINLAKGLF